jgi:DNA ligase-associated metallophosphoesterase
MSNDTTPKCSVEVLGETFVLDWRRAFYWESENILVVSDLHLGKAGHFRKHGIPIPSEIHSQDIDFLNGLLADYNPQRIILLGDLFHSDFNEEWFEFKEWILQNKDREIILVKGNHDILDDQVYQLSAMKIVDELVIGAFHFTHEFVKSDRYNISGHIHPSVLLKGHARQGINLPCFYFDTSSALMPAFGNFTGTYRINPKKGSRIYAIAENQIIALIA